MDIAIELLDDLIERLGRNHFSTPADSTKYGPTEPCATCARLQQAIVERDTLVAFRGPKHG